MNYLDGWMARLVDEWMNGDQTNPPFLRLAVVGPLLVHSYLPTLYNRYLAPYLDIYTVSKLSFLPP